MKCTKFYHVENKDVIPKLIASIDKYNMSILYGTRKGNILSISYSIMKKTETLH